MHCDDECFFTSSLAATTMKDQCTSLWFNSKDANAFGSSEEEKTGVEGRGRLTKKNTKSIKSNWAARGCAKANQLHIRTVPANKPCRNHGEQSSSNLLIKRIKTVYHVFSIDAQFIRKPNEWTNELFQIFRLMVANEQPSVQRNVCTTHSMNCIQFDSFTQTSSIPTNSMHMENNFQLYSAHSLACQPSQTANRPVKRVVRW